MSVLVEATTVVIPVEVIDRKLNGTSEFARRAPNRTFRSDGHLAAIGFMNPQDVQVFVLSLEDAGLTYVTNGACVDIAVVDQLHGLEFPCAWLSVDTDPRGIRFAALHGAAPGEIAAYPSWSPDSSMIRTQGVDTSIDPETGLEFVVDKQGRRLYSGRRYRAGDPEAALMLARPKLLHEACRATEKALEARGWQEFSTHAGVDPLYHLVMHFRNQLALVYVEVHWSSTIINPFSRDRRTRLLAQAQERRAIALYVSCKLFAPIWMKSETPVEESGTDGWTRLNVPQDGLRVDSPKIEAITINDAATDRTLNEKKLDTKRPIEISDWELDEFAVYLVSERLKEEGYDIGACTTAPGSQPNIVARRRGETVRVIVGAGRYPNVDPIIDRNRLMAACEHALGDGGETALAKVSIASFADDFVGKDVSPLFRGERFVSRFKGLEFVNPAEVFSGRHVRLFVSSTFKDFEHEREILAKRVLPDLKRRAAERGVQVSLIDLRWGVPRADVQQAKEAAACLREIDKAHPFFVLLLGQRHGTIRSAVELKEVLSEMPWLIDGRQSISITELEMRYAMLKPNSFNASALVFVRMTTKAWGRRREDVAPQLKEARVALQAVGYRLHPMDKNFAEQATEHLWSVINRHYPAEQVSSRGIDEQRQHQQFGLRGAVLLPANCLPEGVSSPTAGDRHVLQCRSSWEAQALTARLGIEKGGAISTFTHHFALSPALDKFCYRLTEFVELTTGEMVSSGTIGDPRLVQNLLNRLENWAVHEGRSIVICVSETDLLGDDSESTLLDALEGSPHVSIVATRVASGPSYQASTGAVAVEWRPEGLSVFVGNYLAAHGKALDAVDAQAVMRHPLAGDLSFLRFYSDHLLSAAKHDTLAEETGRILRCRTFVELSQVIGARIEAMCEPDDDWRVALQSLPTNGATEDVWRACSKLEPMPFARCKSALSPMLETWGDWSRLTRGTDWTALVAALRP